MLHFESGFLDGRGCHRFRYDQAAGILRCCSVAAEPMLLIARSLPGHLCDSHHCCQRTECPGKDLHAAAAIALELVMIADVVAVVVRWVVVEGVVDGVEGVGQGYAGLCADSIGPKPLGLGSGIGFEDCRKVRGIH